MKKLSVIILSMILLIGVLFTGCGKDQSPNQILLDSVKKTGEIKSSAFDFSMNLTLDTSKLNATNQELAPLQMFNEIGISMSGKQNVDPLQFEGTVNLKGMNLSLDIPILLKDNTLYVKVPAIFQSQIGDAQKQYISMDATEIVKNSNAQTSAEENQKIVNAVLNSLDSKAIVKEDVKNFQLTDGKAEEAVSIVITKENLKPFLQKFMTEGLPIFFEQYEKYAVTEDAKKEIQQMKDEFTKNKPVIDKTINEIDKYLTLNSFKTTTIIDENGFSRKSISTMDAIVTLGEQEGTIGVKMNMEANTKEINKEQKFEMAVPTKDQVIDYKEVTDNQMMPQ